MHMNDKENPDHTRLDLIYGHHYRSCPLTVDSIADDWRWACLGLSGPPAWLVAMFVTIVVIERTKAERKAR
jgi:hypothetical protein